MTRGHPMTLHRLIGSGLLVSLLAACNCDDPLLTVVDTDSGTPVLDLGVAEDVGFVEVDAGFPDAGFPDSGVPEARVLTFDGTSPTTLYFGANRDLRFFLRTPGGAPVPGEVVRFTAAGNGGALASAMATTDASGAVVVRFNAGNTAGTSMITAAADRATNVVVSIEVREDPAASLLLQISSSARLTVPTANARIYLGAAGVVPTCAQLLAAGTLPASTLSATFTGLPASRSFSGLGSGLLVTALVTGENTRGELIARGCSEGTRLAGGATTTVQVNLQQLPSDLTGDYDVLLQLDLAQTLPPPLDTTLITLTDFLSDPAGWAVYQVLDAVDDAVGTVFVVWTPPGGGPDRTATFAEVRANAGIFNTWRIASIALDDFLVQQLGQDYVDFTNLGDDIAGAIRHFDVGARLTLTSTGATDRLLVHEAWQAVVLEWGSNCPAGDLGCARRAYPISGPNAVLSPVEATYGARVTHAPQGGETERFELALDAHTMDLQYGSLVLFLLNSVVFPNLPPPLNGNSLSQVIGGLVACPDIANSLSTATGLPPNFFLAVCDAAVQAAATALENQILSLNNNGNPSIVTGANGGTAVFIDADHNLVTELVPTWATDAQWSTGNPPTATPILGEGRRTVADCHADSECAANRRCVPVPSYLEVRAAEYDCRYAVGPIAGAVGCAQDADCGSNWCLDPGTGIRVCYGACDATHPCTVGTCNNLDAYDLDPFLPGLGLAEVSACVP